MEEVKILGVVVGKCDFISITENKFFCFFGFIPNEEIYKIFPDFPKEIYNVYNAINQLTFNFIEGEIYLNNSAMKTIYDKKIHLTNFKETNNE